MSVFWNRGAARMVLPPRTLVTGFEKGQAFGAPHDEDTHRRVLGRALDLLTAAAPCEEVLVEDA